MNINKIMNNTFQDNFAESMGLSSMLVDNDLKIDFDIWIVNTLSL